MQDEELKKLQIKMFKHKLEQDQKQQAALGELTNLIGPQKIDESILGLGAGAQIGAGQEPTPVATTIPGQTFSQAIKTPAGQSAALRSGMKVSDLRGPIPTEDILDMLSKIKEARGGTAGQHGAPGQPGRESPGFGVDKITFDPRTGLGISIREPRVGKVVPGPGDKNVFYDAQGRVIRRDPAAPGDVPRSKGQEKFDIETADDLQKWNTVGRGTLDSSVQKLTEAAKILEKSRKAGGVGVSGPTIGLVPDKVLPIVSADAQNVKELVQYVAGLDLRQVLGGQFAFQEGENLLKRTYNPSLPEEINLRRINLLITQLKRAGQAREKALEYFQNNNGSMAGYKGKIFTHPSELMTQSDLAGIDKEVNQKPSLKKLNKDVIPKGIDPEDWQYMTPEQKKLWKK